MRHWPFNLSAAVFLGLALADIKFGFLGVHPSTRVAMLIIALAVFLLPHLDGSLGSINVFRFSFKGGEGGLEIRRQVSQATHAADKAVEALAKEYPLNLEALKPTAQAQPSRQPWQEWREMARVSNMMVQRLAERLGEEPGMLEDLPLIDAVALAARYGKITKPQASALKDFCDARHALIETCFHLKADTPVSVTERAWRLAAAGNQLLAFL